MEVVNAHHAKTHFSKLLARAHAGEEIILARGGVHWERLVPLEELPERQPGRYRSEEVPESFLDELPRDELSAWETGLAPSRLPAVHNLLTTPGIQPAGSGRRRGVVPRPGQHGQSGDPGRQPCQAACRQA